LTLVVVIVVAIVSGCLGALGGRALVRREVGDVLRTAAYSSQRANVAAATVEAIAVEWPVVLERVDDIDSVVRKSAFNSQEAKRQAGDAIARQDDLERAVVGGLGISLRRRR
jgi:hypothetical protein